MICVITMIILAYVVNGYCLIAMPICWLINCMESVYCSTTLKYTEHPIPLRLVEDNVKRMKKSRMRIVFHIQNYHYETRTTTSTDSDGNITTSTTTERVNTHRA